VGQQPLSGFPVIRTGQICWTFLRDLNTGPYASEGHRTVQWGKSPTVEKVKHCLDRQTVSLSNLVKERGKICIFSPRRLLERSEKCLAE
jgi:hypothetical protein